MMTRSLRSGIGDAIASKHADQFRPPRHIQTTTGLLMRLTMTIWC
jgi:hypothetical protein